jgi:hypothetical protein
VLSFPFIYFSESGLFKGLRPVQIKNSPFNRSVQAAPRSPKSGRKSIPRPRRP